MRFVKLTRRSAKYPKELTASEIEDAKTLWETLAQQITFSDVRKSIEQNQKNRLVNLGLFIGQHGVIRARLRVSNAALRWDKRFPQAATSQSLVHKAGYQKDAS